MCLDITGVGLIDMDSRAAGVLCCLDQSGSNGGHDLGRFVERET